MEFTVPKFIEKEARIVGPLTFKQFIFIGTAAGICLVLFFILPFAFFIIITVILLGLALALSFLKVQRTSMPDFVKNFFVFIFKPRVYLWKKKTSPPKFLKKPEESVIKKEEESIEKKSKLKVSRGSRIDELFTRIETKK